jgi:hypothetical protein
MKILNVSAQDIPACVVFPYKTFEISVSAIFKSRSLVIFDSNGWRCTLNLTGQEELFGSAQGIREAMEAIDRYIEAGKPPQK